MNVLPWSRKLTSMGVFSERISAICSCQKLLSLLKGTSKLPYCNTLVPVLSVMITGTLEALEAMSVRKEVTKSLSTSFKSLKIFDSR